MHHPVEGPGPTYPLTEHAIHLCFAHSTYPGEGFLRLGGAGERAGGRQCSSLYSFPQALTMQAINDLIRGI